MRRSVALLVVGVLLTEATVLSTDCVGQLLRWTSLACNASNYKGLLKPDYFQFQGILRQHAAWLRDAGPKYSGWTDPKAFDSRRAILCDADLSPVVHSFDNLSLAVLIRANLKSADLSDAKLRGAILDDAILSDATLDDADLTDASLSGADLDRADLSRANLDAAGLSDANFEGANLKKACLADASLYDTVLKNATLNDAILNNATLKGADLRALAWSARIWTKPT